MEKYSDMNYTSGGENRFSRWAYPKKYLVTAFCGSVCIFLNIFPQMFLSFFWIVDFLWKTEKIVNVSTIIIYSD